MHETLCDSKRLGFAETLKVGPDAFCSYISFTKLNVYKMFVFLKGIKY